MAQLTLRDYLQITEDAISAGRIDDAMEKCQHILTFFPESLEAQRLLGEVYLAQGQLEDAQQTFDWILANDPENVIVYCDRALISERMDDIDTALDCYQQAYELSRGNSQIRQEFNSLSAKAGQQDFMFSRAGLARLYMRGDLLPHAVQEWEVVLNASPDRLDARTGLLETYWREGQYDQVERLANEILDDIPSCLKALLLLAHVTSVYNIEQGRELLSRAEALDPEMAMAQDLFNDLIASQPKDPFVTLLKKGPVIVPESLDGEPGPSSTKVESAAGIAGNILSPALTSEVSDSHLGWSHLESWSELDTMSVPQQHAHPVPESSAHATWSGNGVQNLDTWAALSQSLQSKPEAGHELEVWEGPQKVDMEPMIDHDEAAVEEQPWDQAEHAVEQADESIGTWNNVSSLSSLPSLGTWGAEAREAEPLSPPAWLDMLTRGDDVASGTPTIEQEPPAVLSVSEQPPVESATQVQIPISWDRPVLEPAMNTSTPSDLETERKREREEKPAFFFASDDKEEDMGWPEWLKSLGAATMEPEPQMELEPQQKEVQEAFTVVPEPLSHVPSTPWLDVLNQEHSAAQALPTNEQHLVTSLEDLEHDLHSQGFIPLEPGSLATIAQEQQIPTLSSAFAQFGDLPQQPTMEKDAPQTEQLADTLQSAPVQAGTPTSDLVPEQAPTQSNTTSAEPVNIAPSSEPSRSPAPEPAPVSSTSSVTGPSPVPTYHADALLENELETTMRRPSIRLQPMQQRLPAQQDSSLSGSKGRAGERGGTSKTSDSSPSYKERLLRGYHAQLDGSYDNAMQEYRIIIRNAPELLGEVISNLRALLKLVPRYTLGYRVLGDAYMRRGEYLQAMEAYNKALTMAKKAKSQGSSG